jgi:hypothetical protein
LSKRNKAKSASKEELFEAMGYAPQAPATEGNIEEIASPVEESDVMGGDMVEGAVDAIPVALQSATLDWMDDAIELFSPELANEWRDVVQKAKERSPKATLVAEVLTPDVIDAMTGGGSFLLKKLPKLAKLRKGFEGSDVIKTIGKGDKADNFVPIGSDIVKGARDGAARGAVTEGISQQGRGEEMDVGGIAGGGLVGGVVGAGAGAIKNRGRLRSHSLGMTDRSSDLARTRDVLDIDEYNTGSADLMEKMDMFGGRAEFDADDMKFKGKGKKSNFVFPPSVREVLARTGRAKKEINKKIDDILANNEGGMFDSGKTSIELKDFKADVEDFVREGSINTAEGKTLIKSITDVLQESVDSHGRTVLTPFEANTLKKDLYERINWGRKNAQSDMTPDKERAYRFLASKLRQSVNDVVGDPKLTELNDTYGQLADVSSAIENKILGTSKNSRISTAHGAPSVMSRGIAMANTLLDKAEGMAGQVSQTLNTSRPELGGRDLQSILQRAGRKTVPAIDRNPQDNPRATMEPEVNPNRSYMKPQDRLDFNLTKQLQQAKIPRNSEAIAKNPNLFRYKIAQEAETIALQRLERMGVDTHQVPPEKVQEMAKDIYDNMDMLVTEMKDEIPAMLPLAIQEAPQLFEKDPFNRIDDTVPNSMRPDVQETIRKSGGWNKDKSTHEMIAELDELHSTGKYYG